MSIGWGGGAMICRWLFHCWFVVGCFIADEYFFVGECFWRLCSEGGGWIGWFDWMRGWLGIGRRCSYARAYERSRTRSFDFLLSQVSQRMGLKILHHPKNDVSFYWKHRIVLSKTSCHFIENNVSFYGKQRVVLDWRSKSCFEDGILGIFGGGVAAWKCDSVECCFWNQCKWLLHNGL